MITSTARQVAAGVSYLATCGYGLSEINVDAFDIRYDTGTERCAASQTVGYRDLHLQYGEPWLIEHGFLWEWDGREQNMIRLQTEWLRVLCEAQGIDVPAVIWPDERPR
jgi:hypothetical protein